MKELKRLLMLEVDRNGDTHKLMQLCWNVAITLGLVLYYYDADLDTMYEIGSLN